MNPNSTSPIYIKSRRAVIEGKGLVEGHIVIKIQDGRFEKITTSQQPIEITPESNAQVFEADLVTPGFVDIHTHGRLEVGNYLLKVILCRCWWTQGRS